MPTTTLSTSTVLSLGSDSLAVAPTGAVSYTTADGAVWTAPGPLLVLHYYDRQHPRAQQIAVPVAGDGGDATVSWFGVKSQVDIRAVSATEIAVTATYATLGIAFTARIRLRADGCGFSVSLDDDEIVEDNPRLYRILGIEVLPEFGAAVTGEGGSLTLPNWIGCETRFDKTYPREVVQTIYSGNEQWEHNCNMGVFGITRAQGTLCGIVAAGDMDAQLVCRVHWEEAHTNSVHPVLVYRWAQQDDRLPGRREVRYSFAPKGGEHGEGYVFCGREYRAFLRAERGLQTWAEKAQARPEALDYLYRFFVKVFMAYKSPQPDGLGEYHVTASFGETKAILDQCLAAGNEKLAVMLVGWNIDGHDGQTPTRFPIDERIGGEAGFRDLTAWCRDRDVMLGVHDYYGGAYTCSPDFDVADLVRHRTGEYWESVVWSGGQLHQICPQVYVEKHVNRYMPELSALGLHGHEHIDAIGSFMPCYSHEHPLETRTKFTDKVKEMFRTASDIFGSVSTEMPFGPYMTVVDGYFHSFDDPGAFQLACPIGQYFFDEAVPLLSIALHGSVVCQSKVGTDQKRLLRMIAFGLHPQGGDLSFRGDNAFGSTGVAGIGGAIADAYQAFYAPGSLVEQIGQAEIVAQARPAKGVYVTRYSNGVTVTVNMGDVPHDGVAPMSYRVG